MSGMDGIETTQEIRRRDKKTNEHTVIIAITAYALQGDRERYLLMGMDEYISKPLKMKQLFEIIDKIMSKNDFETVPYSEFKVDYNGDFIVKPTLGENIKADNFLGMNQLDLSLNEFNSLLEDGNLLLIENKAHEIKILSNEIGAESLKTIAFKIELAARKYDLEKIEHLVIKIRDEYKRLRK